MTEEMRSVLETHADEIAGLPADDPLRVALEQHGDSELDLAMSAAETRELQAALRAVDVPELERGLLTLPEREATAPRGQRIYRLTTLLAAAAAALFCFLWLSSANQDPESVGEGIVEDAPAHLLAVKFWHRTCPACREIDPRYIDVRSEFEAQPVLFVTFDMSTEQTRAQSKLLAESLGISELYQDNFGVTGFVILVDAESRRELGRLTSGDDAGRMKELVAGALSKAES